MTMHQQSKQHNTVSRTFQLNTTAELGFSQRQLCFETRRTHLAAQLEKCLKVSLENTERCRRKQKHFRKSCRISSGTLLEHAKGTSWARRRAIPSLPNRVRVACVKNVETAQYGNMGLKCRWKFKAQLLRHIPARITHPSDPPSRLTARWRTWATADPNGVCL